MSSQLKVQSPLMKPIMLNGQVYFTSQYFHSQYKSNDGIKYAELKNFNKIIRSVETYQDYIENCDIVELDWSYAKTLGSADIEQLFKKSQYNRLMIISHKIKDEFMDKMLNLDRIPMRSREEVALKTIEQLLGVKLIRQFYVLGFKIDGYDNERNIAYEIDEAQHRWPIHSINDLERQRKIKDAIGCSFVRIAI